MLKSLSCAIVALTLATPLSATAGDLRLSIANGRVTLVAQDVPLKQVLDEWARVGQTTVVGAERLLSQTVTLELQDVPEARALETLLRSASGYIAKPRTVMLAGGGSTYDRIMIMAASRAPAVSSVPQQFNRPPQQMFNPPLMPDDDEPGNTVLPPGALPPGAIGQMNGPQPLQPQNYPGAPPFAPGVVAQPQNGNQPQMTAPRPGQLPTPMPAYPGNPYQMPPPQQQGTRPGGGGRP